MPNSDEAGSRILVGIDGSENSIVALRWAVAEARARDCAIDAVYVWRVPSMAYSAPGYIPPSPEFIRGLAEGTLARVTADCDVSGVELSARTVEGLTLDSLVRAAEEPDVAMLVVGSKGHSGLAGLVLGSISHSLTHHCPKPLVIVPPGWDQSAPGIADRPILVGFDLSPESITAVSWALTDASRKAVSVEALLVWGLESAASVDQSDAAEVHARTAWFEKQMVQTIDDIGHLPVSVACLAEVGKPAETLTQRSNQAQMLVLGTRRLGRARELIAGSVSHACSSHGVVPVVLVPMPHKDHQ